MTLTAPHSLAAVHQKHGVRRGNVTWPPTHFISGIFWHAVLDQ